MSGHAMYATATAATITSHRAAKASTATALEVRLHDTANPRHLDASVLHRRS